MNQNKFIDSVNTGLSHLEVKFKSRALFSISDLQIYILTCSDFN